MTGRVFIPLGRMAEHVPTHPERTAYRAGRSFDSDYEVRTFPSRGAMLTCIHMQHRGADFANAYRPWQGSRYAPAGAVMKPTAPHAQEVTR